MRLDRARILPVPDTEATPEQAALLAPLAGRGPVLNIFRTLARAPEALQAFLGWGSYILSRKSALPPREREIVILRTGYLCRSGYEWTQHAAIALRSNITPGEIERIKTGSGAGDWTPSERVLLRAAEELHEDQFITEETWSELKRSFSERQLMDLVFTVGQYTQVSMLLNSFGVQLDEGQTLDPDLDGRAA